MAKKPVLKKKVVNKKLAKKPAKAADQPEKKKAAPKKKAVIPVAGSPDANAIVSGNLRELGEQMMSSTGRAPFSIPRKTQDVISRAKELNGSRDNQEVELSAILYAIDQARSWAEYGMSDMSEFAEKKLEISPTKARTMANNYRHFSNLGLEPRLFSGKDAVNFSKFKLLIKPINLGLITSENVAEWLPKLKSSGEGAITTSGLVLDVKTLVNTATPEAVAMADPNRKFSVMMPQSQLKGFDELLHAYMDAIGTQDSSEAVIHAVSEAASNVVADDQSVAAYRGVQNLVDAIAVQAPVIPIMVPIQDGCEMSNLGVNPANKVYGNLTSSKIEFCLAASIEDAAAHLGMDVKSVRAFDFTVSDELMPNRTYAGGDQAFAQEETIEVEEEVEAKQETPEVTPEPEEEVSTPEAATDGSIFSVDEFVITKLKGEEVAAKILSVDGKTVTVKNVDDAGKFKHKARGRKITDKDILRVADIEIEITSDAPKAAAPTADSKFEDLTDLTTDEGEDDLMSITDGVDLSVLEGLSVAKIIDLVRAIAREVNQAKGGKAAEAITNYFLKYKLKKTSKIEDITAGFVHAVEVAQEHGVTLGIYAGASE